MGLLIFRIAERWYQQKLICLQPIDVGPIMLMLSLDIILQLSDIFEMLPEYCNDLLCKALAKSVVVGDKNSVITNISYQSVCMTIYFILIPWQHH